MDSRTTNSRGRLFVAAAAAFCVYFCMYAFRKPFTAGSYAGLQAFGVELKVVLVLSQLAGYLLSKFIGIRVISEMRPERRAAAILGLIAVAELALAAFAFAPIPLKVLAIFANGLPLGMVFGLVLGYLEGRRQTEALAAVLCASFIVSSGVVKSVGRWLIDAVGVSEFTMPMLTGLLFLPPLLASVWLLQRTPPPDGEDRQERRDRREMNAAERRQFTAAYWPGLTLLVFVYMALTVIRTIRDDFGVEIWRDLGADAPSVYATSETAVALLVVGVNAAAIWIRDNRMAMRATIALMRVAFSLVFISAWLQITGAVGPMTFMIACGVGLYVPYVAFHTTMFERLIAASGKPCNLGFLMYLADSLGYLGYAVVVVVRARYETLETVLPFFRLALFVGAAASLAALVAAALYFGGALRKHEEGALSDPYDVAALTG